MITKAKAIEILQELSSRLDLVKQGRHTNSPEFVKWHRDAEVAIRNIFPENHEHLLRFQKIEYKMGFDTRLSEEAYENFFQSALNRANAMLVSMIEEIQTYWKEQQATKGGQVNSPLLDPKKVFVVHGRNEKIRRAMFDFLRSIKLEPIEWAEAVTATGEATPYIGTVLDKAFSLAQAVVVIMTPDDLACLQKEFQTENDEPFEKVLTPQARPNVLFEAGMAFGRNADRTVLVEIGKLRPFSDITGRHVLRFNGSTERRQELAERLRTAGCSVDTRGTDWHKTGLFELVETKQESIPPRSQATTDELTSQWKNDFLDNVVPLKTMMMRCQSSPGDWYPIFETTILDLARFVARIPKSGSSPVKQEIAEIVKRLSEMTDSQVVYGAQDVFVSLERLVTLTGDL